MSKHLKILAVDTATEACSAAVLDETGIREKHSIAPRQHARLIIKMIDELLTESSYSLSQFDALAFGRGPGAFTGIRIAAGVIQGLAFAKDLPVVPVSTLAALAQGAGKQSCNILSAIDARMGEIYWAAFKQDEEGLVEHRSAEVVCKPGDLNLGLEDEFTGTGSGWDSYSDILAEKLGPQYTGYLEGRFPRAADIATLAVRDFHKGLAVPAEKVSPVYLRNKVTG